MDEHNKPTDPAGENAQQMTAYLEDLLVRQIARLQQYDLDGAIRLAEESERLSDKVSHSGVLNQPGLEQVRNRIEGLYKELCLTIASQRDEVSDKLTQIRTGMKTLGAYSGK